MIFDSHCHPQFPQYEKDLEEVLGRAREAGIRLICVGTDYETSKQGIELAQAQDNIWATVGLHPNDIPDEFEVMIYHNLLRNSKVVAIGEVGLDYYRTPEPEKQKKQKDVFEQFIDLAIKYNKPLVLHFRDSPKGSSGHVHKDALDILDSRFKILNSVPGVSHSFTGNLDEAREYLNRGMCLGFNGIITFARQYDEVVRYIPLENIILETDAPYLTPEPHRGKRNEPVYVIEVAKKISELKSISLEKVIEQTTDNCKKLFGLL
ncbi:MAG: hypothetical protein A3B86_00170 [Candidatus Yanofskybacteria bacterium RIFCSPHIGHO2_02_FULL_38_22b]|uniref:Hydrolase TatD n=1 Tax=Candidatus Yanofskybacteria bacterium RIFCSPHIGHO2_02_FULL_38_22b TaxID=1802673 RepID=A0A1F8F2V7_9BACT|nr:MAG: hypothetical protein A2816_01110 [Candidatus Yanofskybacteria bacterium RIFCSPHIGHO2_01_FULL_39_44]OGN07008.1 MAG: hypothetical protein A3B86_00170 [Candidatus Yanofskybacteria bacterium RIFCSPHIGHO2_02_FULL_38_22b]